MTDFNYQKAYCVHAVPAFNKLPKRVKAAHAALLPLVGELSQGHNLAIPLNDAIWAVLEPLTSKEIAEMSYASHAVEHWHPSLLPRLFDNTKGESWKVTNCCDQVLRDRLNLPHNVLIHDGKLRVTFSNRDCWTWEEFGLATEKNLVLFESCGLPFGENTLHRSAEKLSAEIGDMWGNPDEEEDNDLFREFLALRQEQEKKQIKVNFDRKINSLKAEQVAAQKEIEFLLMCNELHIPIDNVIYYKHTDTFCFGWREALPKESKKDIWQKLGPMRQTGEQYKVEFK